MNNQERIAKLFTHLEGGFSYLTEETGGAVGLPRPRWSDVGEVNNANGPDEENENEQDAADKDLDTPRPKVKIKGKMKNGKRAHRL